MSIREELTGQVDGWLKPLSGEAGPCGPALDESPEFLDLTKAAQGKPETQFEKGTPPEWPKVRTKAKEMLDQTRDLRVAILLLRAWLRLDGVGGFGPGLRLVSGLLGQQWEHVHPLPDPDDRDPYARANALAELPHRDIGHADLLSSRLAHVKGVGDLKVRDAEVVIGTLPPRQGEPNFPRDQFEAMLASADAAGVRDDLVAAQEGLKALQAVMDERFGPGSGSDLKPLVDTINRVLSLTKAPVVEVSEDEEGGEGGADGGDGAGGEKGSLRGAIRTRADAVRAIDMVCDYLERAEPSNPASLFLRRARTLVERNFLQLLKELAPNSVVDVARIVGVDPASLGPEFAPPPAKK